MTETKVKTELEDIIEGKQIKTVFQPIISLRDGSVLGYEALTRITCNSKIKNPDELFAQAALEDRLWELEQLCRTTALESAHKFLFPPYDAKLFLNVNPSTMHDKKFKAGFTKNFLQNYKITPDNVIFEITERNRVNDVEGFQESIDHYKNQKYQIAIDDAGAGYSGLNLISDIHPDYIKLDMKLIRNINSDNLKYALVRGMAELSRASDIPLIAEGIETSEELNALINLGIQYGQGYYIQRPEEEISEINETLLRIIKEYNLRKNHMTQRKVSNIYIRNLCTSTGVVFPNEIVSNVYNIFMHDTECFGLCVIDQDVPVGIVTRGKLALRLSGQYGFTLNQNKPISELMDRSFLSVDGKIAMTEVSSLAMSRSNDRLYDFIVVTERERYLGTVTIKDLLEKIIEIEVSEAKHQNPLTGLPGNQIIESELSECLTGAERFTAAYLDIDNFKAYNDVYGFENGDKVIKLLADILRQMLTENEFLGHVGGDDFVVVAHHHLPDALFHSITSRFEKDVQRLYHESDIRSGCISAIGRNGQLDIFPLMSLTAVYVNELSDFNGDIFKLSAALAGMKKKEKQKKREEQEPKLKIVG